MRATWVMGLSCAALALGGCKTKIDLGSCSSLCDCLQGRFGETQQCLDSCEQSVQAADKANEASACETWVAGTGCEYQCEALGSTEKSNALDESKSKPTEFDPMDVENQDCCQVSDPCAWACNGRCDCGGAKAWDGCDCVGQEGEGEGEEGEEAEAEGEGPPCCTPGDPCDWACDGLCQCGGDFSWDDCDCDEGEGEPDAGAGDGADVRPLECGEWLCCAQGCPAGCAPEPCEVSDCDAACAADDTCNDELHDVAVCVCEECGGTLSFCGFAAPGPCLDDLSGVACETCSNEALLGGVCDTECAACFDYSSCG